MKVLEEAAASAGKMSCHNDADAKVTELKVIFRVIISKLQTTNPAQKKQYHEQNVTEHLFQGRWAQVYETAKEWVDKMTTLVECWNKLEGNVDELSSWVSSEGSAKDVKGEDADISIEKLEGQLNNLKIMFAEKQKLVSDLEAYLPSTDEAKPAEAPAAEAPPAESQIKNVHNKLKT